MLALKFAAHNPTGLRRLILANAPASMKIRYESAAEYRRELPEEVQKVIDKHEAAGTFDDLEYEEAYKVFTKRHICNLDLVPEPLLKSVIEWSKDKTVSAVMAGGSGDHFKNEGTLAGFSMIGEAQKIKVRTLLINGNREIASDEGVRPFWREIKVKWVTMNGSTHSPHLEEEERYMGIISEFLIEE